MQRHICLDSLAPEAQGAAVAMGNFDGVHLGHQSVLALARAAGAEIGAPLGVVTFEPHPRSYFTSDAPPFRLMSASARARQFETLGVEQLYEIPFDAELANMSAENFIRGLLRDTLGVRHLVVGADFKFGAGRSGDVALLKKMGPTHGFGVTPAPLVTDGQGDFSSTAIRTALREGRPRDAARILGHWHRVEGVVEHGHKRGRQLGYPTANISMAGLHLPKFGVYAVRIDILEGPHQGTYDGAASLGERPTFGGFAPNLEVFLLDFEGDLYGAQASVALVSYLRPELKFEGIDALIAAMAKDVEDTRQVLAHVT